MIETNSPGLISTFTRRSTKGLPTPDSKNFSTLRIAIIAELLYHLISERRLFQTMTADRCDHTRNKLGAQITRRASNFELANCCANLGRRSKRANDAA